MAFETTEIERHLLKQVTSNLSHARVYLPVLKKQWFTRNRKKVIGIVKDIFNNTPTVITKELFEAELNKRFPNPEISKKEIDRYMTEWILIEKCVSPEAPDALIEKLKEKERLVEITDICSETLQLLQKGDVKQASANIKSKSINLENDSGINKPIIELVEFSDIKKEIEKQKEHPELYSGIRTGFSTFDKKAGGLFKAEMTLVSAVTGVGKCSPDYTKCYTKKGFITIKEIFDRYIDKSKCIVTDNGEWYEIDKPISVLSVVSGKIVYQKVKRLYREKANNTAFIHLRDNSKLEAGLNHGYLTNNGWKHVKDLIPKKDWIAVASKININNGEKLNKNLVELLAWSIAEGSETSSNRICITQDDLSVLSKLSDNFNKLDFECSGIKYKNSYIKKSSSSNNLNIVSKDFITYLKKEFEYEYGRKSGNKKIPVRIQNSHIDCVRTFLRAYSDAEGCVNSNNIEISSKSLEIIEALRYMLRRFGILCITSSKMIETQKGMEKYWRLNISSIYARIFRDEIGFGYKEKQEKLIKLCDRKINTNVGDSVPCKHLLKELVEISNLHWFLKDFGLEPSYYCDKNSRNPSKNKIKELVIKLNDILKNGWNNIRDSKRKQDAIQLVKKNKKRIIEIVNELKIMSSDDLNWLEVVSIKKKKHNDWLYDLEMEGKPNYILDLAISHNSTFLKQLVYNVIIGNPKDPDPLKRYNGKNVLHVTNEEHQDQVRMKYFSLFTKIPYYRFKKALLTDFEMQHWENTMNTLRNDCYGKVFIKEVAQFANVTEIYKEYFELQQQGIDIDIIVLDYLDHLAPVQRAWSENDEQAKKAWDFKAMSIDLNIPVVTATQAATIVDQKQEKGRGFGKLDIYGSKRPIHASNNFMGIMLVGFDDKQLITNGGERNSEDECDKFWDIKVAKSRDGANFKFECRHKVETGEVVQDWHKTDKKDKPDGLPSPEDLKAIEEETDEIVKEKPVDKDEKSEK